MCGTSPETGPPPTAQETCCECPQGFARLLVFFRHREGDLLLNTLYRRQQVERQGKGNISLMQLQVESLSRANLSKIRGPQCLYQHLGSWNCHFTDLPTRAINCCKRLAAHVPTALMYPLYNSYMTPMSPLKGLVLQITKHPRAQPGCSRCSGVVVVVVEGGIGVGAVAREGVEQVQ